MPHHNAVSLQFLCSRVQYGKATTLWCSMNRHICMGLSYWPNQRRIMGFVPMIYDSSFIFFFQYYISVLHRELDFLLTLYLLPLLTLYIKHLMKIQKRYKNKVSAKMWPSIMMINTNFHHTYSCTSKPHRYSIIMLLKSSTWWVYCQCIWIKFQIWIGESVSAQHQDGNCDTIIYTFTPTDSTD